MSLNPVEPFSKLLKSLSENFSFEKLSNSRQSHLYFSLLTSLDSMKSLLPSSDFLEILKSKSKCNFCLENGIEIFSECSHGFCTDCLESNQDSLTCPICENYLIPTKSLQNFTQCVSCDSYLRKEMFYSDSLCHPHCKLCISLNLSSGNLKCVVCVKTLKLNPETYYQCFGCGKKLGFFNSNYLCRVHSFCIQCFCEGIQEKKCIKCCRNLECRVESEAKTIANPSCKKCKTSKHASLFIVKSCCNDKYCIACQLSFGEGKCLGCQKRLDKNNFSNFR